MTNAYLRRIRQLALDGVGDPSDSWVPQDLSGFIPAVRRPDAAPSPRRVYEPEQATFLRSHIEPPEWQPKKARRAPTPDVVVLLVTVPKPVPGEPLMFAIAGLLVAGMDELLEVEVFVADDLTVEERAAVVEGCHDAGLPPPRPLSDCDDYLFRLTYQRRAGEVAWRLPTDRARLARHWTTSERGSTGGGFSFIQATKPGEPTPERPLLRNGEVEDGNRPRWRARMFDSVHGLAGTAHPGRPDKTDLGGARMSVSLNAMVEALTGTSLHTLEEAAEVLGIDPNRYG